MSHRKKKHDLGCKEGWFIPTHSTGAFGTGPSCFLTPFLDDARLTDDIKAYLNTKNNTSWWKTTAEWEEFMMQAEVAWHAHLVEEQRKAARRSAGGILEGSDEDDSASTNSDFVLNNDPSKYVFANPPQFGNLEEELDPEREDEEEAGDSKDEPTNEMKRMRIALIGLDTKMRDLVEGLKIDRIGAMEHLWSSIADLGSFADSIRSRITGVEQEIGDSTDVLDAHNLADLSEGVMQSLLQVASSDAIQADVDDLKLKIDKLGNLIRAVDEDHQRASKSLLTKFRSIPSQIGSGGNGPSLGTVQTLSVGVNFIDDGGVVCSVGEMFEMIKALQSQNASLSLKIESLAGDLAVQGSGVLDGLAFRSEAQALEAVQREAPDGDAFEVFLDVMSLFCCDQSYEPSTSWAKLTKALENDYSLTARKVVASYYQTYCYHYTEGKTAQAGIKLQAFKDYDKWNGVSGMDGRRKEIETSANDAALLARTWIGDKLPPGGRLAPLALKMVECSVAWIHTVHKHLDTEYLKLTQQHISEDEALILVSEEVIIMYQRIQQVRSQRMEFVPNKGSKIAYMARCVWITCQVHRVMHEFVDGGLKNNPAISTAFVRFLTRQTAQSVASGIGSQLKAISDSVATMKGAVSAATSAAKEATQAAKEANTRASTANTNADAAKNGLNALYSKNSTLKR